MNNLRLMNREENFSLKNVKKNKIFVLVLAEDAIKAAISDYKQKKKSVQ